MTLFLAILLAIQLQLPAPVGYVNDFAGVIGDAVELDLLAVIEDVRAKSGGEIVVVTLRDLGGRASIDVARDIGREWSVGARGGPGDRARNAGVIVLLKPGERPGDGRAELAIATGSGAEGFITDALAGHIRDAIGEASVEAGSYGAGLLVGVQLLAEAYAREFGFALSAQPVRQARDREPRVPNVGLIGVATLVFFFLLLPAVMRASRSGRWQSRRYYRRANSGLGWMLLGMLTQGGRRGGGWRGGGGGGGGGGFGGFGGGGGFSGGGASGRF